MSGMSVGQGDSVRSRHACVRVLMKQRVLKGETRHTKRTDEMINGCVGRSLQFPEEVSHRNGGRDAGMSDTACNLEQHAHAVDGEVARQSYMVASAYCVLIFPVGIQSVCPALFVFDSKRQTLGIYVGRSIHQRRSLSWRKGSLTSSQQ